MALVITGCSSTRPVVNLKDEPVEVVTSNTLTTSEALTANNELTIADVEKAILEASEILGWTGEVIKPGLIEATLILRKHEAIVDISYSKTSYSIDYKSSKNLKYKNGKIHNNYNRWIANLSKNIKEQINFNASLTGDEAVLRTAKGVSIWQVDGERKASATKIAFTGKGIKSVVFQPGIHNMIGLISKRNILIGNIDFKAKHEYLIDYVIEDRRIYYWVKDITDDVVVYGKERTSNP